jgi:hypothetical protein
MNKKEEDIACQLLDYLHNNPDAGDTLEGIANWWLVQQRIEHVVEDVAEALDYLVREGVVRTYNTQGGIPVYKIKHKLQTRGDAS